MLNVLKFNIVVIMLLLSNKGVWASSSQLDMTVLPVAKNVYSIISPYYGRPTAENQGWNANSHFVVTQQGVLVFDTGSSQHIGEAIIRAIETVTQQPIRWVVNSHSHADHWLGNHAFAMLGAEIISTKSSIHKMQQDGKADQQAFFRMTNGATGNSILSYPTTIVSPGEKRVFGGVDVQFISANNGHSIGDILVWLPQQKVIIGGDVLSAQWLPIMTPSGNVPQLINALKGMIHLTPNVILTGHGEVTTIASIKRDIAFLTTAWHLISTIQTNNLTFTEAQPKLVASLSVKYGEQYQDFDRSIEYLLEMMYQKQRPKAAKES